MKIEILYQSQYTYAQPVSFSVHLYRLFPKADRFVTIKETEFQTNASALTSYRRDLFDNEVASCYYPEKSALLSTRLRLVLEIAEKNAFGFLLAPHALELPFEYTAREQQVLAPYRQSTGPIALPFWQMPDRANPTLETLVALNLALHNHIAYERREEGAARSPQETLSIGRGSCRDFAVLFTEVLRGLGLAARLASGYVCEFEAAERRAEGALHAWSEVYLPGGGWIGFDPTNGVLCNHNHLTAAVGLTPEDVSPVLGRYFHDSHVPALMNASLSIHEIP